MAAYKHFQLPPDSRLCLTRICMTVWHVDPQGADAPEMPRCPVCGSENSFPLRQLAELYVSSRARENEPGIDHRKLRRSNAAESPVQQLTEVIKIVLSRCGADYASVACFLLNGRARLGGLSPIQALCEGKLEMTAKVRQLAIESLE